MMQTDEARIRQRAYEIWLDEGTPEGRAEAHWQQAEQELSSAGMTDPTWQSDATGTPVTPQSRRKVAR